ncbi:MAG: hypothetical protein WCJ31_12160 [Planctomycetia bacterium]
MSRDDGRIAKVLEELAYLGRRIGERAGELARLTKERQRASTSRSDDGMAGVAAAAADLATEAAAVVASREPSSRGTERRKARREPTTAHNDHHAPNTSATTKNSTRAQPQLKHDTDTLTENPRPEPGVAIRRSRRGAIGRAVPRGAGQRGVRKRAVGPLLASALVHVVAILGLATIFVVVEAKPIRLALTVGDAAEPAFEEAALVSIDTPALPDEPVELLTDAALTEVEPLALLDPAPAEPLLAEHEPADDVGGGMAALDPSAMLAEIGGAGDAKPAGSGQGGGAAGGKPAAAFFGRAGQGRSVCFICDNSNSYSDGSFHVVLEELARAVDALKPEQSFFVIFASDAAYPLFHPAAVEGLQPATAENKKKLRAWLGTVEMCRGGQGINEAVKQAAALGAEVVYLLSDGELGASVVDRLEGADFGGAVVHTFGMQQTVVDRRTGEVNPDKLREQQGYDRNLAVIATAHGGTFTPVFVAPQAVALERLRPIPRNRARGAVWGLKL